MKVNNMVVRFKDKTLIKGRNLDFSPNRLFFHLTLSSGEVVKIDVRRLKAAFFVKRFAGNKHYKYTYKDILPSKSGKFKVEFFDSEVMIGYAEQYPFDRHGFFITPADIDGNNEKVFAVTSSIKRISLV